MRTIVVGAGSAGCVLAYRLSALGDREVLLLEAGPDYPHPSSLPDDLADGTRNSMREHDWGFRHRPTTQQVVFPFPRGRVVGGSSAVNTCIALRGQPWDYDEWADRGMPEWSWDRCLPAFKRLERDLDYGERQWHGASGPLPIRRHRPGELVRWQQAFLEACDLLGYPACPDSNEPNTWGAGPHAMNKVEGRRISASEAYLTPTVRARPSLTILPHILVRRVRFEGTRASGVEIERDGRVELLEADEVIVCAGAINTPGILLRSGIGPRADLDRLGIDVVCENDAVGARLLDHPGTAIFFRPRFGSGMRRGDPLIQTVLRYGSQDSGKDNDMILQPGSKVAFPRVDLPMVSLMCSVGKPRGTGTLRWESADPRARPVIESMLLEDPVDRGVAVDAMMMAAELAGTAPMRSFAAHLWPSKRTLRSREKTDAWIRRSCDSGYHPCGTVPMGAEDDRSAATDPHGRVRGVEKLRVVDASLLPTIPSSNIHLATLMVAERIAEMIPAEA